MRAPPKPHVLVADNDPESLQLLADTLTQMGAAPCCVTTVQGAVDLINKEKFDGVFLEWGMPTIEGHHLVEHIRWSKSNSRCPIVMMTGVDNPSAIHDGFKSGASFFLHKPVSVQQLETLLNATRGIMALERRRYQRAPMDASVSCEWRMQGFLQRAQAQGINVSTTGLLLKLELTPPSGGTVELHFRLPELPQAFDLTGHVVRITPDQLVGLRFVGASQPDQQRLMAYTDRVLRSTTST